MAGTVDEGEAPDQTVDRYNAADSGSPVPASRHVLVARPEFRGYEVSVGWYAAHQTFFAYVLSRQDGGETDPWVVNAGGEPAEIQDAAAVLDLVRPYADIPEGLYDQLARVAATVRGPEEFEQDRPCGLDRLQVLGGFSHSRG